MRKKPTFVERLAALEASVAEVAALEAEELARERRKYGDNWERIIDLKGRIEKLAGPMADLEYFSERAPEPFEGMLQELDRLKGSDHRAWWEPGWRCPCGHTFTLWLERAGAYTIYCEGCLASCGEEDEDALSAAWDRKEGRDLDDNEFKALRFQNYMFRKCLREELGVPADQLPRHINRLDPRPRHEILEHVRQRIADLRPPGAADPSESDEDRKVREYLAALDVAEKEHSSRWRPPMDLKF
jgi:hypothetical protein